MPRRLISTGSPFEKIAGYSRAVIDGDFAFVAGTTGYDYTTMTMPADVTSQSRNCFKTIEAALNEGGFAMADIADNSTHEKLRPTRILCCVCTPRVSSRNDKKLALYHQSPASLP